MSLRLRINLIIALISMITFFLAAALIVFHARSAVIEEVTSSLRLAEKLLEVSSQPDVILDRTELRHLRIISPDDKGSASAKVVTTIADVPLLFTTFVQPEKQYLSKKMQLSSGNTFQLLADPADEIRESWQETRLFLIVLFVLTLTISLAVFWLLGRALRPIPTILQGLADIEQGAYQKRLPDFELPEFSQISSSFNTMAAELEYTQQENHRLNEKMLNVQENERRHLAQELHDEMGQSLSAIKALSASSRAFDAATPVKENLQTISSICDELFKSVRTMMQQLRPQVLDELGLIPALEEMVQRWQGRSDCTIRLHKADDITALEVSNAIHLYRIAQESITNAIKHSNASEVHIFIEKTVLDAGESVTFTIIDNGTGFIPEQVIEGMGLNGMRERALSLGADFDLQTKPGVGTAIKLVLPAGGKRDTD